MNSCKLGCHFGKRYTDLSAIAAIRKKLLLLSSSLFVRLTPVGSILCWSEGRSKKRRDDGTDDGDVVLLG